MIEKRKIATLMLILTAAVSPCAIAQEHGQSHDEQAAPSHATSADPATAGEHHEEGPSLFTGDLGNIFWSLLTFIAVILVLGRFAWGPLLGALQKREDFIRESLAEAKRDREAAEARLAEYEAKLEAAKGEASAIVEEGRRDAESVRQRIERETRREADAMLERAKKEIDLARDTAVSELYNLTARLATDVAGKIIAKELTPSDHEALVSDSIKALAGLNSGDGR